MYRQQRTLYMFFARNAEAREELYFKVLEAMEADYRVIFQDMSYEQKVTAMLNGYEGNDETLTNT